MYAKCMSISRRQLARSTGVAAGSRASRRAKIWPSFVNGSLLAVAGVVMWPGMAFQYAVVAISTCGVPLWAQAAGLGAEVFEPVSDMCAWIIRKGKTEHNGR